MNNLVSSSATIGVVISLLALRRCDTVRFIELGHFLDRVPPVVMIAFQQNFFARQPVNQLKIR